MKVVILAGGLGTRLTEETETKPKPMVEIGGRPILWHIMKHYAHHGFREFFLALGYKGEIIKRYFLDYAKLQSNFTVNLASGDIMRRNGSIDDWTVHLVDTGVETLTGGRIKQLSPLLGRETFLATYGDGVCNIILAPDGRSVIEAPYAKDMLDHVEFDTIYHEHLCYFSLTALDRLFRRHGLEIVDVEWVPIHGGTLRFTSAHAGAARPGAAVVALLDQEQAWGVNQPNSYLSFSRRVADLKLSLVDRLAALKGAGERIAAYGASAKGTTLLNYCGIGRETL